MQAVIRAALAASAVALSVTLASCSQPTPVRSAADPVTYVPADDAEMFAAESEARKSLPIFWEKRDRQALGVSQFRVKAGLKTVDGGVEHIWVDVNERSGRVVWGTLANEPAKLGDLRFGSPVEIDEKQVSDWSYMKDGKIYGAYTVRALMTRQSPEAQREAQALLSAHPLEASH